ncbi:MAG: hypothetical protein RML72_05800 [Bacteroidia bacterium]|nr:hypothetical protein [Bacteroidia bacterium]MDW8158375.1 hypothetical protein [Bacteroidia bacterium]
MQLPRPDEYNTAIQNPQIAFKDPELQKCSVETNILGLPKPYSGGFTITYKLLDNNTKKSYAIRCLHRDIQNLPKRYEVISNFLNSHPSRFFVKAQYLLEGIRVSDKFYPIIKMPWLEGQTLNAYLEQTYKQEPKVKKIISEFENLVRELEELKVAHGDLQHGNIIVKDEHLFLIDYDGMYLPALDALRSNEIGHINYQHPKRSAKDYDLYLDRFSTIVIYLGLQAITLKPSLWEKYNNGENILFTSKDFADPKNSLLLKELSEIAELKPHIEKLISCCYLEPAQVPKLDEFLGKNIQLNVNVQGRITVNRSQYLVLKATDKALLLQYVGQKVEVVGKVVKVKESYTREGLPCCFINFGGYWPYQSFTVVLWQECLIKFKDNFQLHDLENKWVSVIGIIQQYLGVPEIVLELPSQLQVLSGEEEAKERLALEPITSTLGSSSTPLPEEQTNYENENLPHTGTDKEADIFNKLYKNKVPAPPPPPRTLQPLTEENLIPSPFPKVQVKQAANIANIPTPSTTTANTSPNTKNATPIATHTTQKPSYTSPSATTTPTPPHQPVSTSISLPPKAHQSDNYEELKQKLHEWILVLTFIAGVIGILVNFVEKKSWFQGFLLGCVVGLAFSYTLVSIILFFIKVINWIKSLFK